MDLSCILNHAVTYFPRFFGKPLLVYLCVSMSITYLEGSDQFLYPLMKPSSRYMLLGLVIEVFYNKCSSIFVHNWLILIRDTIMCKKQ